MLSRPEIFDFLSHRKLAVISTIGPAGEPQSALVGIAVSPELEIIFDTAKNSRKYPNLKRNPAIAIVIGWEGEQTMQYEGVARETEGEELARARQIYFAAWPSGVERHKTPRIALILVRPVWIRLSDFDTGRIEELRLPSPCA